jgi:hypothetical protein
VIISAWRRAIRLRLLTLGLKRVELSQYFVRFVVGQEKSIWMTFGNEPVVVNIARGIA